MRNRSIAAAAAAVLLLSGCAIHPEPEDVTGLDTADIVKQIRCETRDAARKIIVKYLERHAQYGTPANAQTAQNLLAQYAANPDVMTDFNPNVSFPGPENKEIRNFFGLVYSAAIAYTFELRMNEDNNLGGTVNFVGPWNVAKVTLGISPNFNRSRENLRTFTITDKFSFLLKELNTPQSNGRRYCDGHIAHGPNYIYPIAGQIGVYKTVYTFFQLSIFENLAADKAAPGAGGAPAMADDLTFTTMIDVSATPAVIFAPVTSGFQVSDATSTGTLRRRDAHQVTVGLALEPSGNVALSSLRGFVFSGAGTRVAVGRANRGEALVLNRITGTATTRAEALALHMVDQLKSRQLQLIPPPPQ